MRNRSTKISRHSSPIPVARSANSGTGAEEFPTTGVSKPVAVIVVAAVMDDLVVANRKGGGGTASDVTLAGGKAPVNEGPAAAAAAPTD